MSMATAKTGRWQQRRRTRKDLLEAAARLIKQGQKPSLEAVADEAQVSRATIYRYFPNTESLLIEAPLDVEAPDPASLFADFDSDDPTARVEHADAAFHSMMAKNEVPLRLMLASALERRASASADETPVRQDRRTPVIEAALAPARSRMKPGVYAKLRSALALVIGTEAMIVFKDVLQLDDSEAAKIRRWVIRALVDAALEPRGNGRAALRHKE
jgi:AcrR family transcriptional regulator